MNIKSSIQELENLDVEIKRLVLSLKKLRKVRKDTEKIVINYLNEKQQPGLKYNNNAIFIEKKNTKIRKMKKQQETDIMQILLNNNIPNPDETLKQILIAKSGTVDVTEKIKFQKI